MSEHVISVTIGKAEDVLAGARERLIRDAQETLVRYEEKLTRARASAAIYEKAVDDLKAQVADLERSYFEFGTSLSPDQNDLRDKIMSLSGDGRGSGRTGKQMIAAPHGAIYAWATGYLSYPRALSRALGRTDLLIRGPDFLRHLGGAQIIVRDHAWSDGSFDVV